MKKHYKHVVPICSLFAFGVLALLFSGCASAPAEKQTQADVPNSNARVVLHKDKDIQGVWLADGFNFKGYDAIYVGDPVFKAVERPNEVETREAAMHALPTELTECLQRTGMFPLVTTRADDLKPGTRSLKLSNTITEYEKGGGGARYFAGVFGAGQPVIKVRDEIQDGDKLVCVYEMRRSGESAGARLAGVYMKDQDIQRNDIHDLASDFADFVKRTAAKK